MSGTGTISLYAASEGGSPVKKKIAALLVFVMMFMLTVPSMTAMAAVEYPEITAEAAVVVEVGTGRVLYDKGKDQPMSPASMTKVMTALIVLENMQLTDIITAGPDCKGVEGSVLELKEGEELTVQDLLYGLMLKSTNDAAIALAEGCAGSIEAFADLMNQKAADLGAVNTHFVTPNGLTDPDHYTTPYDMALIMRAAASNATLCEIMATPKYIIPATNLSTEREVVNSNRLLADEEEVDIDGVMRPYRYDGLVCGKTGYTKDAGSCLVEYVKLSGIDVIAVTMKSTYQGQYPDMIKLLDSVDQNNTALTIMQAGNEVGKIKIPKGGKVKVAPANDVIDIIENEDGQPLADPSDYEWTIEPRAGVTAPLNKGDAAADLILTLYGEQRGCYELCVVKDVKASFFSTLSDTFRGSILLKFLLTLIIFLIAIILVGKVMLRPNKKRAERRKEQIRQMDEQKAEENRFYETWEGTAPEPVVYDTGDYYEEYEEEEEAKPLSDVMTDWSEWSESEWNADSSVSVEKTEAPVRKSSPEVKKTAPKKKRAKKEIEDNFVFEISDKNKN